MTLAALRFDPARLDASLAEVGSLSAPSDVATVKVHHGYRQTTNLAPFEWVLREFAPVKRAWLSYMEAGAFILPHIDAAPWWERWQVPIHPAGYFRQDGHPVEQVAGVPFAVKHWTRHEVVNDTDRPRVHLVIDRDIIAHDGDGGFEYWET